MLDRALEPQTCMTKYTGEITAEGQIIHDGEPSDGIIEGSLKVSLEKLEGEGPQKLENCFMFEGRDFGVSDENASFLRISEQNSERELLNLQGALTDELINSLHISQRILIALISKSLIQVEQAARHYAKLKVVERIAADMEHRGSGTAYGFALFTERILIGNEPWEAVRPLLFGER